MNIIVDTHVEPGGEELVNAPHFVSGHFGDTYVVHPHDFDQYPWMVMQIDPKPKWTKRALEFSALEFESSAEQSSLMARLRRRQLETL